MSRTNTPSKKHKNPITVEFLSDGTVEFHGWSLSPTEDKNKALDPHGLVFRNYGLQFVMLPSEKQKVQIHKTIGYVRLVRNDYLSTRQQYYNDTKETLSVSAYKKTRLEELKKEKEFLAEADKFALESAIINVYNAYQNFFKQGFGFPKFVSRYAPNGNRYTTHLTNNSI